MIPILVCVAIAYWLVAPDPVTAGARTAAGTGARAAGSGARAQWAAGRPQRRVRRTERRDRWGGHVEGAKRHPWLLRAEHVAAWLWGAAKGTGKLAAAAVQPVPAAARAGWSSGVERHKARAKDRPVPIAVDPPWWRRDTHTDPVPGQPEGQVEDTPEADPGTGPEQAAGTGDPDPWQDPALITDTARPASWVPIPAPSAAEPQDVTGIWKRLQQAAPPTDEPAGTSPAGVTTPPTEGDPMPSYTATANVPSVELNDLDSLRRFAEYIASLGDDSEFMQIVERCKTLRESLREGGFGGHVDQAGASFEETAAALGQLGTEFCEEAAQMAQLAANVAGG